MNKGTIRGFGLGMLIATSILGIYYYSVENKVITESEAKEALLKEGYKVYTKEEYEQLQNQNENDHKSNDSTVSEQKKETKVKKKKDDGEAKVEEKEKEVKEEVIYYMIDIKSGMNARATTSLLKKANIIQNAAEFERFLITNQYSKKLQVGTHKVNNKMSYEEIAKTITTKNR